MQNLLRAMRSGDTYPGQVLLDEYLSTWFSCLWRLSVVAPVREHGAALVGVGGGLSVAAARPGGDAAFAISDEEMRKGDFLGYYHTHPYESGTTGAPFSAPDLRVTIRRKLKVCFVQSGDELFMVARTPDTPEQIAVDELSNTEFNERVASSQRGKSWQAALLETDLHYCREYGLAFYAGKLGRPLERR